MTVCRNNSFMTSFNFCVGRCPWGYNILWDGINSKCSVAFPEYYNATLNTFPGTFILTNAKGWNNILTNDFTLPFINLFSFQINGVSSTSFSYSLTNIDSYNVLFILNLNPSVQITANINNFNFTFNAKYLTDFYGNAFFPIPTIIFNPY